MQEIHEGQPNPASSVLAFFGDELRRRRLAQGWSQGELARRVFGTGALGPIVVSTACIVAAVFLYTRRSQQAGVPPGVPPAVDPA